MHVAGVAGRRAHLRAPRPRAGRQQPRGAGLRAVRQGHGAEPRRAGRASSSTTRPRRAAVERLKEREHRGYHYEAADASFELLLRREAGELRAALPARELPRDHREARRRQGRDRGDDQDLGRRASATCAPPRATARSTRSTARCATRSPSCHPHLRRHRAGQLQGPHPRRAPRHRRGHAGAARLLRRQRESWGTIGVSENIIEASWEALVDSLEYAFQPHARRDAQPGVRR